MKAIIALVSMVSTTAFAQNSGEEVNCVFGNNDVYTVQEISKIPDAAKVLKKQKITEGLVIICQFARGLSSGNASTDIPIVFPGNEFVNSFLKKTGPDGIITQLNDGRTFIKSGSATITVKATRVGKGKNSIVVGRGYQWIKVGTKDVLEDFITD